MKTNEEIKNAALLIMQNGIQSTSEERLFEKCEALGVRAIDSDFDKEVLNKIASQMNLDGTQEQYESFFYVGKYLKENSEERATLNDTSKAILTNKIKQNKKYFKIIIAAGIAIVVAIAAVLVYKNIIEPSNLYDEAIALEEKQEYSQAYYTLLDAKDHGYANKDDYEIHKIICEEGAYEKASHNGEDTSSLYKSVDYIEKNTIAEYQSSLWSYVQTHKTRDNYATYGLLNWFDNGAYSEYKTEAAKLIQELYTPTVKSVLINLYPDDFSTNLEAIDPSINKSWDGGFYVHVLYENGPINGNHIPLCASIEGIEYGNHSLDSYLEAENKSESWATTKITYSKINSLTEVQLNITWQDVVLSAVTLPVTK